MPSITGAQIITGARILVPVDLATARGGLTIAGVATIERIMGTVSVSIPGPVEAVLDVISTVGTIVSGALNLVERVGSISGGLVHRIEGVATVGTVVEGKVTASVSGGAVDRVGSIASGLLNQVEYVATVGSIVEGKVTASITGTVPVSVQESVSIQVGTIGTIVEGKVTASIVGTVTTDIRSELLTFTSTVSADISTVPGRLYGVVVSVEGAAVATLLVLNYGAPSPTSSVLARIIAPPNDTSGFMAGVKGISYATLAASLIGVALYSVYYEEG
ncbi:MAG: hypothetical protein QXP81_09815 [Nitrososphaerota archaeon]